MRPMKLVMQAFGSYGEKTPPIDFTKTEQNLFLVTGDTGAGKTTIFDAIVFALYGEASSVNNKKDGTELQSQFTDFDKEPFVELTFSEKRGEKTEIYTVRRTPRHVRPLKRGSGFKEESESVSLIMPDNTVYPQKETDKKLREIIGLTKEQFMQVAMIAQGEFMELLRAKSDDKKVIFRKLFGTELFQGIVEELFRRKKEKYAETAQIHTACQTEAGHLILPKEEETEILSALQKKILASEKMNVADMETLMDELQVLCAKLEVQKNAAQENYEKKKACRDEKRDNWKNAQNLLTYFEQIERANRELLRCEEEKEEIEALRKRMTEIDAAYEIRALYQSLSESEKKTAETEKKLAKQQEILPLHEKAYEEAENSAIAAKKQQAAQQEVYAKISERVGKALLLFDKIEETQKIVKRKEEEKKADKEAADTAKARLDALEEQEREWKKQSQELKDADSLLTLWKVKCGDADKMLSDAQNVRKLQEDAAIQKERADSAKSAYETARLLFLEKNTVYTDAQTAFLDAQAGFIAREKLKEGEPCPVCGSLEHPHPCELLDDRQILSREELERLKEETDNLHGRLEDASANASACAGLLQEKERNLEEQLKKLKEQMKKSVPDVSEELTLQQAEERLKAWKLSVETEGIQLKENVKQFETVQQLLSKVDEERKSLKEAYEKAKEKEAEVTANLAADKAVLADLQTGREYASRAEATAALSDAKIVKKETDDRYLMAEKAEKTAKESKDRVDELIQNYGRELPEWKAECAKKKADYVWLMDEKKLSEEEWQNLTAQYEKAQTVIMQKKIEEHNQRKAGAEGMLESAKTVVGNRQPPDVPKLEKEKTEAEEALFIAEKELETCRECWRADTSVYQALLPKMEERKEAVRELAMLEGLYNRLSGKVSGFRMDIETFVQRYYLERILVAANVRFREMSAGQFELRMIGEEQAGEGKNRGLDLMVYSAVTGKEREIRTLSGGESFMAALSLALGMADQIQESSAAVNLDIMFIDEGFGSLDEHSRNQAVRVLKQMAGGSRLIGIISHVTELKQEIEAQLLVSKDETGSHAKWQIS